MDLFKKKTASETESRGTGKAGNNKVALLVLVVLLGAFAYLYFFTSLIVPHEAPPPPAPAPVPQLKQSMPPRPADTTAAAPAAGTQPQQPPAQGPNAAAPAPGTPAVPASAKPAPAQPQAVAQPAKPAAAAPPQPAAPPAKPAAAPAPKKEEPKPAAVAGAKPAPAAPKKAEPQAVKPAEKKEPAAKEKAAKPAKTYTIFAGELPAGEDAAVLTKLAKANIKPVVKHEKKKGRKMNRLYFGTYGDFDEYTAALDKLKQSARGAFAVEKDGRYSVYAGSFGSQQSAEKEKKALAAKGVRVELQQVNLPLSTVRITAGSFKNKADADRAAARLKKQGVAASVIAKGK